MRRRSPVSVRPRRRGRGSSPRWKSQPVVVAIVVLAAYSALSIVAYWPVLPFDDNHILAVAPNDSTDVGWFLAWAGYAVTHAHNVLFTNWMDFPTGINIPANQSMPLLGVLAAPVKVLWGPFAMMNFTMHLSFVASGAAMYITLRNFCERRLPAFVGGLFFGFCPFIVAHSLENQNFTFLPALPLIFLFAYRIVGGESAHARRDGLLLGFVCAIQLYLNPEPLAEILVVLVAAAVLSLAWRARRLHRSDLVGIVGGSAFAAVIFVVLAIPFAYYYLAGPQHTSGPIVGLQYLAVFHTDLAQLITPDSNQLIAPARFLAINPPFGAAVNEAGSYLGIPLLLGLVCFTICYRRIRVVAFAAIAALVGLVLSLGPELYIDNKDTGVPLPARLLLHLPILQSAETIRYFVATDVAVAVLLAVGLDRVVGGREAGLAMSAGLARTAAPGRSTRPATLRRLARPTIDRVPGSAVIVALAAVLLFPLIPRWPYQWDPTGIPPYFTTNDVAAIAPGATVLSYPIAQSGAVQPMQWQMAADFRFKIISGYGYVADNGGVTLGNPPMNPAPLATLINSAWANSASDALPALTVRHLIEYRELLANMHVKDFVMLPLNEYEPVEQQLTVALDERPASVGGVLVWYGVPQRIGISIHTILVQDRRSGILVKYPPVGTW